jgi:hypothetical protein
MLYWGIIVYLKMRNRQDTLSSVVIKTYNRVFLYPFAMILFWFLNFVSIDLPQGDENLFSGLSMLFGVSYGTATAVIFFVKSEEARSRWAELFLSVSQGTQFRPSTSVMPVDFGEDGEYVPETSVISDMHLDRCSGVSVTRLSTISNLDAAPVIVQRSDNNSVFEMRGSHTKPSFHL